MKKALIETFEAKEQPEEHFQGSLVATLDPGNLITSVEHMDKLFEEAEVCENVKYSILFDAVQQIQHLALFAEHKSPGTYTEMVEVIKTFVECTEEN